MHFHVNIHVVKTISLEHLALCNGLTASRSHQELLELIAMAFHAVPGTIAPSLQSAETLFGRHSETPGCQTCEEPSALNLIRASAAIVLLKNFHLDYIQSQSLSGHASNCICMNGF